MNNSKIKYWIEAARLRTLPLALASVGMGIFLAASKGFFDLTIAVVTIMTTIFLQVLSNFANDLGDSTHGADSANRLGPKRMVQQGVLTFSAMKKAVILFSILSLVSGVLLLYVSLWGNFQALISLFVLGILSIVAAIAYTNGKKPYGYLGFGDFFVFLFFGLVGVMGSYYLFIQEVSLILLLPAIAIGFFSTGVLNVNNIRDIKSDRLAGKFSIPVRIGREKALVYHALLLLVGHLSGIIYLVQYELYIGLISLLIVPIHGIHWIKLYKAENEKASDLQLKPLAISIFLYTLLYGVGILI